MYSQRRCIDWLADGAVRRGSGNVALPRPPHASLWWRFPFFRQRPFVNDNTQAHREGRIMLKRQTWLQWSCLTSRSIGQSVIFKAVCEWEVGFFCLAFREHSQHVKTFTHRGCDGTKMQNTLLQIRVRIDPLFGVVIWHLFYRAWLCDALNYSAKDLENQPQSSSTVRGIFGGELFVLKIFKPPEAVWFVVLSYISETDLIM